MILAVQLIGMGLLAELLIHRTDPSLNTKAPIVTYVTHDTWPDANLHAKRLTTVPPGMLPPPNGTAPNGAVVPGGVAPGAAVVNDPSTRPAPSVQR